MNVGRPPRSAGARSRSNKREHAQNQQRGINEERTLGAFFFVRTSSSLS